MISQIILHFRQYAIHEGKKVLKNYGGYTVLVKPVDIGREGYYRVAVARCGKKVVSSVYPKDGVVELLSHYNDKCHERYDTPFFQRLIGKLDETRNQS